MAFLGYIIRPTADPRGRETWLDAGLPPDVDSPKDYERPLVILWREAS
jgi:hypothetical protein